MGAERPVLLPRRRLLIVDDDDDCRAVWTVFFQHHGYEVETAADGERAVAVAAASRPDLILLDLCLPIRSGVEAARELKSRRDTQTIPILVVTGVPWGPVRHPWCEGYLAKPCTPDRLLAEAQRVLAGTSPPR